MSKHVFRGAPIASLPPCLRVRQRRVATGPSGLIMMSDNPLIFDPDRSRRLLSLNPDPNLIILKRNNMQPTALGRYQVASILGRGSMGVVYRGHDPVIDRPVALKSVLLPESISDEEKKIFLERFFLEARAAGKLTHPNVVITHDAATDEATGIPFIAMELVDGDTLADRLRQEGTLAWEKAVDFVVPIAGGLAKAHAAGIVHRDIKPANILIADGEVPKIADFGIAKLPASKLTQEGNIVGTPYFMSPEQLRGKPAAGSSGRERSARPRRCCGFSASSDHKEPRSSKRSAWTCGSRT